MHKNNPVFKCHIILNPQRGDDASNPNHIARLFFINQAYSEGLHAPAMQQCILWSISGGVITGRLTMLRKSFLVTGIAGMLLLKCDGFSRRCFNQELLSLLNSKSCTKLKQKGPSKWQYNSFGLKIIKTYPNYHGYYVRVIFVEVFRLFCLDLWIHVIKRGS